jgi:hypothetical protein
MAPKKSPLTRGKTTSKPGTGPAKAGRTDASLEDLVGRPKKWLLDAARSAGLTGLSKLTKEDLVARLRPVLAVKKGAPARGAAAAARAASPRARVAPVPASKAPPLVSKTAASPARRTRPRAPAATEASPKPALAPAPSEQDPAALAKLAVSQEALASEPKAVHIPWSYGMDRVTAAAIDPDQLFAYWEVTDPAIERARAALGLGGPGAWLSLRVYDTTSLVFDGTNAHGYFDHSVDRSTRQWFFHIGKPTSSAFVEIGLKSAEGYFAAIARSGRVDFPRRQPAPLHDPEWMTVQPWSGAVADVHRAPPPGAAAGRAPSPPGGGAVPARFEQIPLWLLREPGESFEVLLRQALEHGWERVEWQEASGEGWFALEGRVEWESPHVVSSWESGPFSYPVEIEPPSREEWAGRSFAYRVGGVTHVVYGPWRVVIRNLGARAERAVHGAWVVYRSWAVEAGHEVRVALRPANSRSGASELLGASERRWLSASELRLGGASEVWRAGASELAYRGASEQLFLGASQLVARGASERRFAGASERRFGGASERQSGGASEARLGGASERQYAGGSEQRLADDTGAALPYPAVPPGEE